LEYIAASKVKVYFSKPYLASKEDVEAFADALKQAYLNKIGDNKRISV
jgi:hypothetical protein